MQEKVVEDLTEFIKVQHRLRQIIKIQAVTRGYLARKQFKEFSTQQPRPTPGRACACLKFLTCVCRVCRVWYVVLRRRAVRSRPAQGA
jgi:hypothetical protein